MKLNDIIDLKGDWAGKVRDKLAEATYVGIDFGTSTTTVTYLCYDEGTGTLIAEPLKVAQEDEQGVRVYDHLVPTVIAMLPDGHLIFGCGAKECPLGSQKFAEGMNVWSAFKMHLGEAMCYPRSRMTRLNTPVEGQTIETPRGAAKHFFAYLKSAIEEKVREEGLPSRILYAITVPASFGPNQREDLCAAIRDAGIELVPAAILDEPNSAFIGAVSEYAAEGGTAMFFRDGKPCKVLVFDFGAGTCDVSVLDISSELVLQNLAVSHFTALGGRDIDERIAEDFLYPKLLGGRTGDDIPVASVKKCLIDKLRPVAEIIKIRLSEKHDDDYGAKAFELAAESPSSFVEEDFYQATQQYGVFESNELRVTAEEFAALMRRFSEDPMEAFDNDHKSILDPIENALSKAGIKKEELDYVLLVGGSSKNPFVRDVLEEYFPRPVTLIRTRDPRTLVAEGAAFHSLVCNGLDSTFMRPITSEEIVVTTPTGPVTVFPAGTPVPTSWKEIADLYIDDESARGGKFIVPFNSANGRREWGKVRFSLPDLESGCDVGLSCSLSEDKTLAYQIKVNGEIFSGALRNPLTSSEVNADERDYIAKQNALEYTAMILGVPSVEQYKAVARASRKLRRYEEEAEHYRQLMYAHREAHFEYEAARAFRDAHKRKEALAWSRKACKHNPGYLNVWYLVWDLAAIKGWKDHETQTWLERALASWPDDLDFKYVDMKCLEGCGQKDEAKGRAEELCEAWEEEGVGNLGKYSLIRFEEVARICEKRQLAVEIRKRLGMLSDEEESGHKDASYAAVRSRTLDDEKKGGK